MHVSVCVHMCMRVRVRVRVRAHIFDFAYSCHDDTDARHSCFTTEQLNDWAWRIPFLSGIVLGGSAIWIRRSLVESAQFEQLKVPPPPQEIRLKKNPQRNVSGATSCSSTQHQHHPI